MEKTAISMRKGIGVVVERVRRARHAAEMAKLSPPGTSTWTDVRAKDMANKASRSGERFKSWTKARADMEKKKPYTLAHLLRDTAIGSTAITALGVYASRKKKKKA